MVRGPRRNRKRKTPPKRRIDLVLQLTLAEIKAHTRLVRCLRAVRMVMHVRHETLARRNPTPHSLRIHIRLRTHRPDAQYTKVTAHTTAATTHARHKDHHMVRDLTVARADLHRTDPFVFRNVRRETQIRKVIRPRCGHRHLRQFDDEIRLAHLPAVRKLRKRRHVLHIAPARALVHPLRDDRDLVLAEARVVRKLPMRRIREPRRHLTLRHLLANRLRPRTHFLIRVQRHRRDFARPVARRTILKQDWRHVTRIRHPLRHGIRLCLNPSPCEGQPKTRQTTPHRSRKRKCAHHVNALLKIP